jgi:hypothetical protein
MRVSSAFALQLNQGFAASGGGHILNSVRYVRQCSIDFAAHAWQTHNSHAAPQHQKDVT